ncbi:uncharacterized protein LOC141915074 [Tubulanus polymorphus]|uniref:uncharacterized protein LOC141915074 n=1 Tax=Tubulanus polymorphus TaxID=672921 RepID=UPI003DA64BAD
MKLAIIVLLCVASSFALNESFIKDHAELLKKFFANSNDVKSAIARGVGFVVAKKMKKGQIPITGYGALDFDGSKCTIQNGPNKCTAKVTDRLTGATATGKPAIRLDITLRDALEKTFAQIKAALK